MTNLEFTPLVFAISAVAGLLGALTGLGGGVVVTPALTLLLGVDIRYAIGASLVSVIATSSGAAAAYVREGYSNIRIGMFLEIATTIGAVVGAYLATRTPTAILGIIFGVVLLHSAWMSTRGRPRDTSGKEDPLARRFKLNGSYPGEHGKKSYQVTHVQAGFSLMFGAGTLSGLLGIGSGALKVIAMDQIMRIPFKVSTTTAARETPEISSMLTTFSSRSSFQLSIRFAALRSRSSRWPLLLLLGQKSSAARARAHPPIAWRRSATLPALPASRASPAPARYSHGSSKCRRSPPPLRRS